MQKWLTRYALVGHASVYYQGNKRMADQHGGGIPRENAAANLTMILSLPMLYQICGNGCLSLVVTFLERLCSGISFVQITQFHRNLEIGLNLKESVL